MKKDLQLMQNVEINYLDGGTKNEVSGNRSSRLYWLSSLY